MPKAEAGSVKDVAKHIKSKGLQKLKFYCQMCQKQCRDANGFKCHIQSESHLRQMKLFTENSSRIMDQYSREFEKVFLDTLRMLHSTVQVNANNVYQQVIRDRAHIHMNATMWASLSDFCQYLGKTGKCRVEETERGWYITYINRDASQLLMQQEAEKRIQAEQQAELELKKRMEERRKEAALACEKAGFQKQDATNLEPRNEDEAIQITLKQQKLPKAKKSITSVPSVLFAGSDEDEEDGTQEPKPQLPPPPLEVPKKRAREETPNMNVNSTNESFKQSKTDPSVWLYRDIVVRIVDKQYEKGRFFKRKAYVDRVFADDGEVSAEISLVPGDEDNERKQKPAVLRLPQKSLETVVPKKVDSKKRVRVLRGPFRGKKASVLSLNKQDYWARLELSDGKVLPKVDFEDFAELA